MRFISRVYCALALVIGFTAVAETRTNYFPLWQKEKPNIADLALIYQGGSHRPQWTLNRFAPYVSYRDPKSGKEQWLFDGFLFIEFQDGNRNSYQPDWKMVPARKEHWLALLEKNFAEDDGIPNLEKICRETAARIGQPIRRRQAIISVPEPIAGQTNWGELNGRALDFNKTEDRLAALEWYLDTALQKWKTLAPKQLDLGGFYWITESVPKTPDFHQAVAKLIHERGQKFYWIPYWQNRAGKNWRAFGFDVVWQQPNHFFHPEVPDSRLDDACDFAKQNGMGMEFECDGRMISDSKNFERRFDAYLDAFEKNGVKEFSSIAYYEGGGALFQLEKSSRPEMRAHYERIAKFILERQNSADKQFKKAKRLERSLPLGSPRQ